MTTKTPPKDSAADELLEDVEKGPEALRFDADGNILEDTTPDAATRAFEAPGDERN